MARSNGFLSLKSRNSFFLLRLLEPYPKAKQTCNKDSLYGLKCIPSILRDMRPAVEVEKIKWIRHGDFFSLSKYNMSPY